MKNNNKIFAIMVDYALIKECFDNYAKVYNFVTSRTDAPRMVTPYLFVGSNKYQIIELELKK